MTLHYAGRSVRAPVWILPGHADGCVTIHLGHGRTEGGPVGSGHGFNAFALQLAAAPWGGPGLTIEKSGAIHAFATTQPHQRTEEREPVRVTTAREAMQPIPSESPAPYLLSAS